MMNVSQLQATAQATLWDPEGPQHASVPGSTRLLESELDTWGHYGMKREVRKAAVRTMLTILLHYRNHREDEDDESKLEHPSIGWLPAEVLDLIGHWVVFQYFGFVRCCELGLAKTLREVHPFGMGSVPRFARRRQEVVNFALKRAPNVSTMEYLVEQGADVNSHKHRLLRNACSQGDVEVLLFLLNSGADIRGPIGSDALYLAHSNGHIDAANMLLQENPTIFHSSDSIRMTICTACKKGNMRILQSMWDYVSSIHNTSARNWFLDSFSVDILADIFRSNLADMARYLLLDFGLIHKLPLWRILDSAARYNPGIFKLVVNRELDAGRAWVGAERHLTLASSYGQDETVRYILIECGMLQPHCIAGLYNAAVEGAIRGGHASTASILLEYGGDIVVTSPLRLVAIDEASRSGSTRILSMLQHHDHFSIWEYGSVGADQAAFEAMVITHEGFGVGTSLNRDVASHRLTAYGCSNLAGSILQIARHGYVDVLRHLIRIHHINALPRALGSAVIVLACEHGHSEMLEDVLRAGWGSVHAYNGVALLAAIHNGHEQVVGILRQCSVNVRQKHDLPLRVACDHGFVRMVRWFLQDGADPNVHAGYPIRTASRIGSVGIVRALIEAGANIHACDDQAMKTARYFDHTEVVACLEEAAE